MKRQGDSGRWSAARDDGDGWRGGSQVDRKATERVYAWGKDTEGVEDGPDSAGMAEEGGMHDPGKYRGITLVSHVLKLLERGLDARISRRVEGDVGKNSKGPGSGEEQQTGCTSWDRW